MRGWGFRPDVAATVLTVAGVVLLTGLGTWQWQRKAEMDRIDAEIRLHLALPPVENPEVASRGFSGLNRRRIVLTGAFDLGSIQLIRGQYFRGEIGYHVVATFWPTAATQAVLVDRGWIPRQNASDTINLLIAAEPATATVEGLARKTERTETPSGAAPTELDPAGIPLWNRMDVVAMAGEETAVTTAVYIVAGPEMSDEYGAASLPAPDRLPIGGYLTLPDHRPHLEYALTWYSLALTLLGVYIGRFLRRNEASNA